MLSCPEDRGTEFICCKSFPMLVPSLATSVSRAENRRCSVIERAVRVHFVVSLVVSKRLVNPSIKSWEKAA